jgi:glycosyltransferase involved in cell wall biosynthesis
MGGRVPADVTYWTGRWEPDKEAISKEVQALRIGHRTRAPVVSIAPGQPFSVDLADRVLRLPTRLWPVLRAAALAIEPTGDVSHVFGGFSSWHMLRALNRRPMVLTAVTAAEPPKPRLPRLPDIVAVESDSLTEEWVACGMSPDRVRVIHPGVDLRTFSRLPRSSKARLQLLFASSPSTHSEFEARGVPMLVELARAQPDIDIVIPWRVWDLRTNSHDALAALRPPPNLVVHRENAADMRRYYASADAVVVLFNRAGGKACPNSVLEGLACGRPALLTEDCAVAPLLQRSGAAIVAERTLEALSLGVERLRLSLESLTSRARAVAEELFDIERFQRDYSSLYDELLDAPVRASTRQSHLKGAVDVSDSG